MIMPISKPGFAINSPNNWMVKAGAYVDENNMLRMPMPCVLLPMAQASEGMEEYNAATNYGDKMKAVQRIALSVRIADTAYFKTLAQFVNDVVLSGQTEGVCQHCVRYAVDNELAQLRRQCNDKIIHGMEKPAVSSVIHPSEFELATKYYEQFLRLPLMSFEGIKPFEIESCKRCKGKK